jgi:hydroxymethylglutaryl-CoA reductase
MITSELEQERIRIPRDEEDDYTDEMAGKRREMIREQTGANLSHVAQYSFDPAILPGNIENFIGVAQVPIGVAGPIRINGEHAKGDFYIPLATTEGSLVASYNRGMRLLTESGGVKTTVVNARRCSSSAMRCKRGSSAAGWRKISLRSRSKRKLPRASESFAGSLNLRWDRFAIFASITPRAMLLARTWRLRRPLPRANGLRTTIRAS